MSTSASLRRPEHAAPPDIYYNHIEARKYADNTRIIDIQTSMTERCIELIQLPHDSKKDATVQWHVLDVGCGSGLSGGVLSDHNIHWTGIDISADMLAIAHSRDVLGDLICCDIGDGLMFKAAQFDGCVSVSVLQWLCNADKSSHNPIHRMKRFFTSLYHCLKSGARAVFQFYPESAQSIQLLQSAALAAGFTGGVLIDFPNSTKAKKYYMCLQAGGSTSYTMPAALDESTGVQQSQQQGRQTALFVRPGRYGKKSKKGGPRTDVKTVEWIRNKKTKQRAQGKDVKRDSKYSGRSRGPKF